MAGRWEAFILVPRQIHANDATGASATDGGVFTAREGRGSHTFWSVLGHGLPNAAVDDLTQGPGGYIYAATHGRGIWRIRF